MKTLRHWLVFGCGLLGSCLAVSAGTVVTWSTNGFEPVPTFPFDLPNSNVVAIAAGESNCLVLSDSGWVWSWPRYYLNGLVTNVLGIAAGNGFSLAVRSNGTVVAGGANNYGQTSIPTNLDRVVQVAAAPDHSLTLRSDGTLLKWGTNDSPAMAFALVPGVFDAAAVACGDDHDLALRSDGTVRSWMAYGDYWANRVPVDLSNVVAIAAGGGSLALKSDGTVVAWGANTNIPSGLSNVVAVSAALAHSLALKSDGTVVSWGASFGVTNIPVELSNVVAISAGRYQNLAITNQTDLFVARPPRSCVALPGNPVLLSVGVVSLTPVSYQWRFNGEDIPDATNANCWIPALVRTNQGAYCVVVSNTVGVVTSALAQVEMSGNRIVAWGDNRYGQTNVPVGLSAVALAGSGFMSLVLLQDGTVNACGDNRYSQTNVPPDATNLIGIAVGSGNCLGLKPDGTVIGWGDFYSPWDLSNAVAVVAGGGGRSLVLLADGTVRDSAGGVPAGLSNVVRIAEGVGHRLALQSDGTVTAWGDNTSGQCNVPGGLSNVVAISALGSHSLALKSDGTVVAWGSNSSGQTHVPADLTHVVAIAAGGEFSLALKADGTVAAWGNNVNGQTNVPSVLGNAVGIGAGYSHGLLLVGSAEPAIARQPAPIYGFANHRALLSVGVVSSLPVTYQWQVDGKDVPGATNALLDVALDASSLGVYRVVVSNELGQATSDWVHPSVPRNSIVVWGAKWTSEIKNVPAGLGEVNGIAAGSAHSLALRWDGTVAAWGVDHAGQMNVPPGLSNAVAVAGGAIFSTALRGDGTLIAWGDASLTGSNVPPANNIVAVSAGVLHALALKADGTLVGWGGNNYGAREVPPNLSNVAATACGVFDSLALKSDGSLVAWGYDYYGQSDVPPGLSNIVAIAAGELHNLALRSDGTVTAWGRNDSGQCNIPSGLSNVVALAGGGGHSLALQADGSVVAWGQDGWGQTDIPAGLSNVVGIAAGSYHSLALTDQRGVVIVREPAGARAHAGSTVLLSVGARSPLPMAYQWRFNGAGIDGATNACLLLSDAQSNASGCYSVVVSNSLGLVTSRDAAVVVGPEQAPYLVMHPNGRTNLGGASVTFQVSADGSGPLYYQWRKNDVGLPGATDAALVLTNLRRSDEGLYSALVTNRIGQVTSSNAPLRVLVPQRLLPPTLNPDSTLDLRFGDSDGGLLSDADSPHFVVRASTNLIDWEVLTNALTLTNGLFWFRADASTDLPHRFYHVFENP